MPLPTYMSPRGAAVRRQRRRRLRQRHLLDRLRQPPQGASAPPSRRYRPSYLPAGAHAPPCSLRCVPAVLPRRLLELEPGALPPPLVHARVGTVAQLRTWRSPPLGPRARFACLRAPPCCSRAAPALAVPCRLPQMRLMCGVLTVPTSQVHARPVAAPRRDDRQRLEERRRQPAVRAQRGRLGRAGRRGQERDGGGVAAAVAPRAGAFTPLPSGADPHPRWCFRISTNGDQHQPRWCFTPPHTPPRLPPSRPVQRGASATHGQEGKDDYLTVHVFRGERGGHRVYYLEHVRKQRHKRGRLGGHQLTSLHPRARGCSSHSGGEAAQAAVFAALDPQLQAWKQGVYSNTPHCLVKLDLPIGSHALTLCLAQFQPVDHQAPQHGHKVVPFQAAQTTTSGWLVAGPLHQAAQTASGWLVAALPPTSPPSPRLTTFAAFDSLHLTHRLRRV